MTMVYFVQRDQGGAITAVMAREDGAKPDGVDADKWQAVASDDTALLAFQAPLPVISATSFLDRLGTDGPALLASPFGFALIRLAAAGSIRLDDPDVVGGMQAAVNAGAITSKRATELLAAPS